jgi:ribosomal protein S27AE
MIRLFTALCKAFLEKLNDAQKFNDATDSYSHHTKRCPRCGAAGQLSEIKGYSRGHVYRSAGKAVDSRAEARRFKCGSCGATHALLPDVLVPYSIYSLQFKLLVLIAYFERDTTVVNICELFDIAVSTLYEWKKIMAGHKDLMLGILISRKTPALSFLRGLLGSGRFSDTLRSFFNKFGFSFMQGARTAATQSVPP